MYSYKLNYMLKNKLIRIKRSRYRSEELFLIGILNDITIYEPVTTKDRIFWKYDEKVIFEQRFKTNTLVCDHLKIWKVLREKYNLSDIETKLTIKKIVEEYLNWDGFIIITWTMWNKKE